MSTNAHLELWPAVIDYTPGHPHLPVQPNAHRLSLGIRMVQEAHTQKEVRHLPGPAGELADASHLQRAATHEINVHSPRLCGCACRTSLCWLTALRSGGGGIRRVGERRPSGGIIHAI